MAMLIHLCIFNDYFCSTTAELDIHRDLWPTKPKIFTFCPLQNQFANPGLSSIEFIKKSKKQSN